MLLKLLYFSVYKTNFVTLDNFEKQAKIGLWRMGDRTTNWRCREIFELHMEQKIASLIFELIWRYDQRGSICI